MVQYEGQKVFVELERKGKLLGDLPDTVDELQEDWGSIIVGVFVFAVTDTMSEFVAETQPFFLYQHLKPFQRSEKFEIKMV